MADNVSASPLDAKAVKERFIQVFGENIRREGADKLLAYLSSSGSDFFTAPASTRFHGAYEGGLCEHSLNVYDCLRDYLDRPRVKELYQLSCSDETCALISLMHDICKVNVYKQTFRNVKNENGVWEKVPSYDFDDALPYGHGEKSVYILSGFMRLTREEAFAIRFHMGFGGAEEVRLVSNAFEKYPLAYALHVADMEASLFIEGKK